MSNDTEDWQALCYIIGAALLVHYEDKGGTGDLHTWASAVEDHFILYGVPSIEDEGTWSATITFEKER